MRTARDNARVSRLFAAEDALASRIAYVRRVGRDPAADREVKSLDLAVKDLRAAADDGADPFDGVVD